MWMDRWIGEWANNLCCYNWIDYWINKGINNDKMNDMIDVQFIYLFITDQINCISQNVFSYYTIVQEKDSYIFELTSKLHKKEETIILLQNQSIDKGE